MTVEFFNQQMARMGGLKFRPADLTTHWEALQDMPEAVLEAAVTRAQRSRVEFPTPAELREDADHVARHVSPTGQDEDRGVDLPEPVTIGHLPSGLPVVQTREWKYYCDECQDSGSRSFWCGDVASARYPWMAVRKCGTRNCRKAQYEHEWVERCPCWESNPALVRKRESQRKYAEQSDKKKSGRAA